jgi:hypothetical protein
LTAVSELVDRLVDALEDPGPVDARGVARVRVLLKGVGSPLNRDAGPDALAESLETTLACLVPADAIDVQP